VPVFSNRSDYLIKIRFSTSFAVALLASVAFAAPVDVHSDSAAIASPLLPRFGGGGRIADPTGEYE
jgi:hypothetical protein